MGDVAIPEEMEDLQIRVYPDKVLRCHAEEIARERFGDELGRLASTMIRLMYDSAGVGLAAPQVGVSLRLVVIDPSAMHPNHTVVPGDPFGSANPAYKRLAEVTDGIAHGQHVIVSAL